MTKFTTIMTLTEGLLIVLIIVVIAYFLLDKNMRSQNVAERDWTCVDKKSGEITNVKMSYNPDPKKNIEQSAQREAAESFSVCKDTNEIKAALNDVCDPNSQFSYATNDFGGPGMDYKDWIAAMGVDPQVVQNHNEFVKDRLDTNAYWTGRTYSPDSHDSYDPIPWVGIKGRPQWVRQCDPTQVPDVDENLFPKQQKLVWSSVAS